MRILRGASIRLQLLSLAVLLVVLVSTSAMLTEPFIYGRHDKGIEIGLFAGRVEVILAQYAMAKTGEEEERVLSKAVSIGVPVSRLSADEAAARGDIVEVADRVLPRIRELIDDSFFTEIGELFGARHQTGPLVVRIDERRVLAFETPVFPKYLWLAPAVASGLLKIIVPLIVLAFISSWLITRPLERIAAAAEKERTLNDSYGEPFETDGALEIRILANSLNAMRGRIQQMAVDRTRMLRAISHDLRTPLTRLRMRIEGSEQTEAKGLMLRDVSTLTSMIDESLAFLNDKPEQPRKVDISSLLQTVASDFADTGINVRFNGPRRLVFTCRPQGLTRAIANLVSNSSRYADRIEVELEPTANGGVRIAVTDDGPGISDSMKKRVVEPFFKTDQARHSGSGFGLGLTITRGLVEKGHNGSFRLLDNHPHGLTAEIVLPPMKSDEPIQT